MVYHFINLITGVSTYYLFLYFESGGIYPSNEYLIFPPLYLIIYLAFSIYFDPKNYSLTGRTQSAMLQFVFTLFTLSLVVSLSKVFNIPHRFILTVTIVPVILRWLVGFFYQDLTNKEKSYGFAKNSFQLRRLIASLFILFLAFIITLYSKTDFISYYNWLEQILLLLIALWWVSGHVTRKFFALDDFKKYYY